MTDLDDAVKRLRDYAGGWAMQCDEDDLAVVLDALGEAREKARVDRMYLRLERTATQRNLERAESAEAERDALKEALLNANAVIEGANATYETAEAERDSFHRKRDRARENGDRYRLRMEAAESKLARIAEYVQNARVPVQVIKVLSEIERILTGDDKEGDR